MSVLENDEGIGREQFTSNRRIPGDVGASKSKVDEYAAKQVKRFFRGSTVEQMAAFSDCGTLGGHFASVRGRRSDEDALFRIANPADLKEVSYDDAEWDEVEEHVSFGGSLARFVATLDKSNGEHTTLLARACIIAARQF